MNRTRSLPPLLWATAGILVTAAAVVAGVLGLTGTVASGVAVTAVVVGAPVGLLLIGATLRAGTRAADRHFAEHGVRGVARVRGCEPVGAPARAGRAGQVRLSLEVNTPGRPVTTHRYVTWVEPADLTVLTDDASVPCLAGPGDPPAVMLYPGCEVGAETLHGRRLALLPHR